MRILCILLCFLLWGCGRKEPSKPTIVSQPLTDQLNLYNSLLPASPVLEDECDAALFTSLSFPERTVDIWSFYSEASGQWYRSPAHDCLQKGTSSDLSDDMAIGLMWYAYFHKDLRIAETLWSYQSGHNGRLGNGDPATSYIDPYTKVTLAQLIHVLGGADHSERVTPLLWTSAGFSGFRAHLEVLVILLRMRLYSTVETSAFDTLKSQASRQPNNALFAYAVGKVKETETLLNRYFPADRLPTSADHCEAWLFQRDDGSDWQPCDQKKTHSGGDFIFVTSLMLKGL
jgi:hypothetical protein